MKPVCFLDRDGVINYDFGYVSNFKNIKFTTGIFEGLRLLQKNFILCIVTNQSGVARGLFSEKELNLLNRKIIEKLKKHKIKIKHIEYCPYHKNSMIKKYKKKSFLRKPNPGMILKILKKYKINAKNCILIGDRSSDIKAGRNAGIKKNYLYNEKDNFKEFVKKKINLN